MMTSYLDSPGYTSLTHAKFDDTMSRKDRLMLCSAVRQPIVDIEFVKKVHSWAQRDYEDDPDQFNKDFNLEELDKYGIECKRLYRTMQKLRDLKKEKISISEVVKDIKKGGRKFDYMKMRSSYFAICALSVYGIDLCEDHGLVAHESTTIEQVREVQTLFDNFGLDFSRYPEFKELFNVEHQKADGYEEGNIKGKFFAGQALITKLYQLCGVVIREDTYLQLAFLLCVEEVESKGTNGLFSFKEILNESSLESAFAQCLAWLFALTQKNGQVNIKSSMIGYSGDIETYILEGMIDTLQQFKTMYSEAELQASNNLPANQQSTTESAAVAPLTTNASTSTRVDELNSQNKGLSLELQKVKQDYEKLLLENKEAKHQIQTLKSKLEESDSRISDAENSAKDIQRLHNQLESTTVIRDALEMYSVSLRQQVRDPLAQGRTSKPNKRSASASGDVSESAKKLRNES